MIRASRYSIRSSLNYNENNMKPIKVDIIIGRISSRKDGSVSFSGETPEFSDEEFATFRKLQNHVLSTIFVPKEEPEDEMVEVKTELDEKTPSQRLRGVLFILWKQQYMHKYGTFNEFYQRTMERVIDQYKERLD